ncbi:unnamed protein product, partial [Laminaria digitata]
MIEWQWGHYDPDGVLSYSSMDLSLAISRLAMQGHQNPKLAMLELFCQNRMRAICSYNWKKYQNFDHFQLSGSMAPIDQKQWQTLASCVEAESNALKSNNWTSLAIDLDKLGIRQCPIVNWEPETNQFSYALYSSDKEEMEQGYFEEVYSACDIMLMP